MKKHVFFLTLQCIILIWRINIVFKYIFYLLNLRVNFIFRSPNKGLIQCQRCIHTALHDSPGKIEDTRDKISNKTHRRVVLSANCFSRNLWRAKRTRSVRAMEMIIILNAAIWSYTRNGVKKRSFFLVRENLISKYNCAIARWDGLIN